MVSLRRYKAILGNNEEKGGVAGQGTRESPLLVYLISTLGRLFQRSHRSLAAPGAEVKPWTIIFLRCGIRHGINACKLECDSIGLLLKKTDQLEKRIEELEKKTA